MEHQSGPAGRWVVAMCVVAMAIGVSMFTSTAARAQLAGADTHLAPERKDCEQASHQEVMQPISGNTHRGEARAIWLTRKLLKWPGVDNAGIFHAYFSARGQIVALPKAGVSGADGKIAADIFSGTLPEAVATRFKYVASGTLLAFRDEDLRRLPDLLKKQLVLVKEDRDGNVLDSTAIQVAGALDDLYELHAGAAGTNDLGVTVTATDTRFRLWAPTARNVAVCIYEAGAGKSLQIAPMRWGEESGVWAGELAGDLSGKYYTFLVEVFVPGVGIVRNRVTDPYSISLTTNSMRSYIANLDSPRLKPPGWGKGDNAKARGKVQAQTDMVIYELHVRDFSINDPTVPAAHRGKYAAFTDTGSLGMKHLKALSDAGMTDVHLLPVFDFATVPESGCISPVLDAATGNPDGESRQAAVAAVKDRDCFNWGYDPLHYTAPEGSYSTNAADGAQRIIEFRQMVAALHRIGLRVGMDVVYNHTSASGQDEKSVLDRIVPGYYQRLNALGAVEKSTCCANTATENRMMAKLMADSVVTWAREYGVDSFRFDLMGHQPRGVMEALRDRLKIATGRDIQLIGEGWNFGEVADGARFVQASQLSLNGSGIGTFSDRGRDAVRGGGAADNGENMITRQGYINGLGYDRNDNNALAKPVADTELLRTADLVRVGLAGSLRDYPLKTFLDAIKPLQHIDYAGQPAGYASQPSEVVNYVENHDNQTLFDINAYKLPLATSREDRARVQILGLAINAFSQGVAYFHAGGELLRSKSLDRNSFDSGDWFNRIDWSGRDNYFATGAPLKEDNGGDYRLIKPLLVNAGIKPTPAEIAWTRNAFLDLLRIRASTPLFRLRTSSEIRSRLTFHNTGPRQFPTLLVGHLNGEGYPDARFRELVYLINVGKVPEEVQIEPLSGKPFKLHPVQSSATAADRRVKIGAKYDAMKGTFHVPARSAAVFVVD